ncbi:MAG: hypothetical protein NVS2B12_10920 [Ktedonobacteraceae bacterium]
MLAVASWVGASYVVGRALLFVSRAFHSWHSITVREKLVEMVGLTGLTGLIDLYVVHQVYE